MKFFCYRLNCHLEIEFTEPELNVLYNIEVEPELYMMFGKFSNIPPNIIPVFSIYLLGWGSWRYLLVYAKTQ